MRDAKELLAAAALKRECDDTIRREGCKACDAWWPVVVPAQRAIERLGFTPATLAVAIKLAEALIELGCQRLVLAPCRKFCTESESWCPRCQALAAWDALGEES